MDKRAFLLSVAAAVSILLLGACLALVTASHWRSEAGRAGASLGAASGGLTRRMGGDSIEIVTAAAQYRTIEELRRERADLLVEIDRLDIARRRVESASRVAQSARYGVRLDTVRLVVADTVRDTVTVRTVLQHHDPWLSARLEGDSLHVTTRDSLTIITHSRRRRFLWWVWHKYSGSVTVRNANPHVTIEAVETINVEK